MNQALSDRFDLAQKAARDAGQLLLERFRKNFEVRKKGRINLVTEMDLEAERLILGRIRRAFPDDEVLSEEEGRRPGETRRRWIVDPLDGTTNYAHGYRFFCVSIAFEYDGNVVLGAVYDPVTDEMFTARQGGGAFLNGMPLSVSDESRLSESLLCTGFHYDDDFMREGLRYFSRLLMRSRALRRDGAAALDLCYVAAGRFEGFWEKGLNAWDVAAGQLIVVESGGRISGLDGRPCTISDRQIVASNGKIHDALIGALNSDEPQLD